MKKRRGNLVSRVAEDEMSKDLPIEKIDEMFEPVKYMLLDLLEEFAQEVKKYKEALGDDSTLTKQDGVEYIENSSPEKKNHFVRDIFLTKPIKTIKKYIDVMGREIKNRHESQRYSDIIKIIGEHKEDLSDWLINNFLNKNKVKIAFCEM